MSDLTKSNFQAFGAGLLGFVAVAAIGGGFLYIHSTHNASGARPVAAGAPIDLASPVHAPAPVSRFSNESRPASPSPLIGEEAEEGAEEAATKQAAAPAKPAVEGYSGPVEGAKGAPRLVPGAQLDGAAASTSAELRFKDKVVLHEEKTAKAAKPDAKKKAVAAKPEGDAVASVHYGATSRSELMGRAAGPVYNFSGGGAQKPGVGKLAGDAGQRIAQLKAQLDSTGLSSEDRSKLQKELEEVTKSIEAAAKTAQ